MGCHDCVRRSFQMRNALSSLAVTMVFPSGLNATEMTEPGCGSGWPSGRPVAVVPEPRRWSGCR